MSPELADFLAELAADPEKMSGYLADPEATMTAAGLADADKEAIRNNETGESGLTWTTGLVIETMPPVPDKSTD